jgi:acetolactate synthase-1/2/3 large subunit
VLPEYRKRPTVVHEPDPRDVERYAKRLMESRAPVIAAGKGVIRKGAMQELSELSLKLQAPVVFAQDAIGVIPEEHPFFGGHFAHARSYPGCAEALKRADLVLAVGLRAGTAEMSELTERAPEKNLVLVGFDDAPNSRYHGEDQRVADPKLFLAALLERMGSFQRPRDEALIRELAARKAAVRTSLAKQNAPHVNDNPIHPGILMDAMNAVLDDDAVVSSDVGNCQMWARTFRRIATPESFMQSGVWNAMSYGLPTAIVAKMEFPQRDVVALAGDGAFLMTIGDLPTAAEYGANILMVILNDGAFGQTYMQQTNIYGHTYGTTFRSPNFAGIAESCGAKGIRVTDPRDVEATDSPRRNTSPRWSK